MNFDEYLSKWTFVKALVKGPPGTGKTFLAAAATQVWDTLYIDVDGGLFSAFPVVKKENIVVRLIRDSARDVFFDRLSDAVAEAESGKYDCVVLDHLTEVAGRMEDQYATGSETGKLEFGDWYKLTERLRNLCRRLKDLSCHTILTVITKPTGRDSASAVFEPQLPGQASVVIPSFFDTVALMRKDTKKRKFEYVAVTDGPQLYQVRDRYRALRPEEVIEEADAGAFWRRLDKGIKKLSAAHAGSKA